MSEQGARAGCRGHATRGGGHGAPAAGEKAVLCRGPSVRCGGRVSSEAPGPPGCLLGRFPRAGIEARVSRDVLG